MSEKERGMRVGDPMADGERLRQVWLIGALSRHLESSGMDPPRIDDAVWAGPAAEAYGRAEEEYRSAIVSARATAHEALRAAHAALAFDGG